MSSLSSELDQLVRQSPGGLVRALGDLRQANSDAAAKVLSDAGFEVGTALVDVSSRKSVHALVEAATALGDVTGVIHAAGVSPSQAFLRPSSKLIFMAPRLCLRSSGMSSRGAALASSFRRCPATAWHH